MLMLYNYLMFKQIQQRRAVIVGANKLFDNKCYIRDNYLP